MNDYSTDIEPYFLEENTYINGSLWLKGVGNTNARIMFISSVALEEEASEITKLGWGKEVERTPEMFTSPHAFVLKDLATREGIDIKDVYYTSVIKYLPEKKKHQVTPTAGMLAEAWKWVEKEIETVKPYIIICMGKNVFDLVADFKTNRAGKSGASVRMKASDIAWKWFYSDRYNCRFYAMDKITQLISRPDKAERVRIDLKSIRQMLYATDGIEFKEPRYNVTIVKTSDDLRNLVTTLREGNHKLLAIDCEWHGQVFTECKLRSLQIAWTEHDVAYIYFRDAATAYTMDIDYKEVGSILGEWCNRKDVKYIGHHLAADLCAISHWLGLDWYRKGYFDTEFALQCCNEASDLGLDYVAIKYTAFGKYDWDLDWWKKENPGMHDDGYGYIPDDIIIPYACKDVLVVMQAYPAIKNDLIRQDLWKYYETIFNPFTTDVLTSFSLYGLPINRALLDEARDLYQFAHKEMLTRFIKKLVEEASDLLCAKLVTDLGVEKGFEVWDCVARLQQPSDTITGKPKSLSSYSESHDAWGIIKNTVDPEKYRDYQEIIKHYVTAPYFNVDSTPAVQRWLFAVKGHTPIKTTGNKAAGSPSIPWEKVLEYPPEAQKEFKPAVDAQTLEIISSTTGDPLLKPLLELNSVGNICRSFLKEAVVDEDGNVVSENGLHAWVDSNDTMHPMYSTTETGRPRSWKPNALNWPSWVHKRMSEGVSKLLYTLYTEGAIPNKYKKYLSYTDPTSGEKIKGEPLPSVRSIVEAAPGHCMVECDYQTAEVRSLAFISGDEMLMGAILNPDPNFAKVKPEYIPEGQEDCVCRLSFPPHVQQPEDKDKFLMTYTVEGVEIARFTEDMLERDEEGNIAYAKFDMHWTTTEATYHTAREVLNKKRDRGAGKTGRFAATYGGGGNSIERKIESDTGVKPEAGTGQLILSALEETQPVAEKFLKEVSNAPELVPYLVAASGRKRHLHTLSSTIQGLSERTRKGQLSSLGRECRNFFMQESVASTAAIACIEALAFKMNFNLKGYPMICLYDSIVNHVPCYEREIWSKAMELFMHKSTGWSYDGRLLRYPVDEELNKGWSTKPSKEFKELLANPEWESTPDKLKNVVIWLDTMLELYDNDPRLSIRGESNTTKIIENN